MYQGRIVGFAMLVMACAAAGAWAQVAPDQWPMDSSGQHFGRDCQNVSVQVRETQGLGISGATVTLEGIWEATTDFNGVAVFECREGLHFPAMVEVSAPGYKATRVPINPAGSSPATVELDRASADVPARGIGETVSAKELSPEIRQQSDKLQTEASKAIQAHDYATAQELLLQALKLTPSSASIYNNLGVAYLRSNDVEGAASWFEKAVKAAPREPSMAGNLGLVRWLQHRPEESYDLLLRADSQGYESVAGHCVLGMMMIQKGMDKKAIEHLKKVPLDKFPYRDLFLSIAQRNMGKKKAADESYRNFLKNYRIAYASGSVG